MLSHTLGRSALLLVLVVGASVPLFAQTVLPEPQLPTDRPVVGLVLSGGSAKGIAHVGALTLVGPATVTLAGHRFDEVPQVSVSLGYPF